MLFRAFLGSAVILGFRVIRASADFPEHTAVTADFPDIRVSVELIVGTLENPEQVAIQAFQEPLVIREAVEHKDQVVIRELQVSAEHFQENRVLRAIRATRGIRDIPAKADIQPTQANLVQAATRASLVQAVIPARAVIQDFQPNLG